MSIFDFISVGCGVIARQVPKKKTVFGAWRSIIRLWATTPHRIFAILGLNRSRRDSARGHAYRFPKKNSEIGFPRPPFGRIRREILFCLFPLNPWRDFKISRLFLKLESQGSKRRPGFCRGPVRNRIYAPRRFRAKPPKWPAVRGRFCANVRADPQTF